MLPHDGHPPETTTAANIRRGRRKRTCKAYDQTYIFRIPHHFLRLGACDGLDGTERGYPKIGTLGENIYSTADIHASVGGTFREAFYFYGYKTPFKLKGGAACKLSLTTNGCLKMMAAGTIKWNKAEKSNIEQVTNIIFTQREGKGIATGDEDSPKKPMPASTIVRQDPDELIRIPYEIHGKFADVGITAAGWYERLYRSRKSLKFSQLFLHLLLKQAPIPILRKKEEETRRNGCLQI
ncbi:hypothetical protein Tco_1293088 [Tanacetum coccineum]